VDSVLNCVLVKVETKVLQDRDVIVLQSPKHYLNLLKPCGNYEPPSITVGNPTFCRIMC